MFYLTLSKRRRGFTIIELVMVIVVVGIIAGMGAPLAIKLIDSYRYSVYRKDLSESADVAFRRMMRELPRLRNETRVIAAGTTAYSFENMEGQYTRFYLEGTDLKRECPYAAINTLVTNVQSFNFTYLDDYGAVIATPKVSPVATDIRFIKIAMSLQSGENTVDYETKVKLERLKHISDLFP